MLAVWILLGIVALLAVPVGVAFRLGRVEAFAARLDVRWLFGLVRVQVRFPRVRARAAGGEPRAAPAAQAEGARARPLRERRAGPSRVARVLGDAAFRRRAGRLVREVVRAAHLAGLRLRIRLGLGDPADTGLLWAVVGPLTAAARAVPGADVVVAPEFVDPVLELDARGRARVVPLQVLGLAAAFALSPSSLRAWRTLRAGRA